jgi:DNA invertase Pin-like site-specific DNA recombinase
MSLNTFSIKPNYIYVYLRVSTHAQTHKSNGLEEQNEICQAYIKKHFPKLINSIEFHTDVGSSYNGKNKLTNLNKIIRRLSTQTNALLLVRDISRLGRDTFQVFNLLRKIKKSKSYIIGIEEDLCYNHSRLMDRKFSHSIIDSEEHSDFKSIKSTNRINKIISNGGYIGRVPYGCMVVKKNNIPYIYKNPNEINIILMIKQVFLKYRNVPKTVKYLNTKNFKYRNGIEWNDKQITNYLKKFFPNLLLNRNSDRTNNYFSKYQELNDDATDNNEKSNIVGEQNIDTLTTKLENINLNNPSVKPKRKYTKHK